MQCDADCFVNKVDEALCAISHVDCEATPDGPRIFGFGGSTLIRAIQCQKRLAKPKYLLEWSKLFVSCFRFNLAMRGGKFLSSVKI